MSRNFELLRRAGKDEAVFGRAISGWPSDDGASARSNEEFAREEAVQAEKEKPTRPLEQSIAQALEYWRLVVKYKWLNPAVKTEMELKSLLPKGARIMGLIPHIEIASDARRDRRLTIFACIVCGLLCLALISVIWNIHLVL